MGKIIDIQQKILVKATLPDGIYVGTQGGSEIELYYSGTYYLLTTDVGVRGINLKVIVTIKDGIATYELLKN